VVLFILVNKTTRPDRTSYAVKYCDLIKINVTSCTAFLKRALVLTCCLLLFNLGNFLGDRVENQVLETCIDELERLWQFVQVDARISH
jgi:hypothetical protein